MLVALAAADRSKKWLSIKTGIPYSTLDRKLRTQTEFTFADLAEIAHVLGVSPASFTPTVFTRSPQSMKNASASRTGSDAGASARPSMTVAGTTDALSTADAAAGVVGGHAFALPHGSVVGP